MVFLGLYIHVDLFEHPLPQLQVIIVGKHCYEKKEVTYLRPITAVTQNEISGIDD